MASEITYLYIDDELEYAKSCSEEVERVDGRIRIECRTPDHFDEEIAALEKSLDSFDGLILDWRLDQIPPNGKRVAFRAGALAQELRTRGSEQTEGKEKGFKELPIVLWSVQSKLDRSFYGDSSSSDLFDWTYLKESLVDTAGEVATQLVSLARGYVQIAETIDQGWLAILAMCSDQAKWLDSGFTGFFEPGSAASVHDYARFLLNEVLHVSGPLVEEKLLAARLGTRAEGSAWDELLSILPNESVYNGPFRQAWPRWWWPIVERVWWDGLFEGRAPKLSTLPAAERVSLLKEKTGLASLAVAEPIKSDYGQRFYTICAATRQPLDPVDGVLLADRGAQPWQDSRYISVDAAMEGLHRAHNWKLDPTEEDRVRTLKERES